MASLQGNVCDGLHDHSTCFGENKVDTYLVRCMPYTAVFPFSVWKKMGGWGDRSGRKKRHKSGVAGQFGNKLPHYVCSYLKQELVFARDRRETADLHSMPLPKAMVCRAVGSQNTPPHVPDTDALRYRYQQTLMFCSVLSACGDHYFVSKRNYPFCCSTELR